MLEQARERLIAGQAGIAVELGCKHLDAGTGSADAELHVGTGERLDEASRIGSAGGARYAEEESHRGPISGPWRRG